MRNMTLNVLMAAGLLAAVGNLAAQQDQDAESRQARSADYQLMLEEAERKPVVSPMPYFGEEMTVAELIDLVEFLHAQYTKLQPQYYRGYYLTQ